MLFTTDELSYTNLVENNLNYIENNSSLITIPVTESDRLQKNIISLEDISTFVESSTLDLEDIILEIADLHSIDLNSIVFSVRPSSVYLDDNIQEACNILLENQIPIFIKTYSNSNEYSLLNELCFECERSLSTEPLDLLIENVPNIKGTVKDFGRSFIGSVGRGFEGAMKSGFDKHVLGKVFDTKDNKGRKIRNGQLDRVFGKDDSFLKDMAHGTVEDLRYNISSEAIDKLDRTVGMHSNNKFSLRNLLDVVSKKLGMYEDKMQQIGPQNNPMLAQKRSIFQRLIDKLRKLKDKILSLLRGGRK